MPLVSVEEASLIARGLGLSHACRAVVARSCSASRRRGTRRFFEHPSKRNEGESPGSQRYPHAALAASSPLAGRDPLPCPRYNACHVPDRLAR